MLLGRLNNRCQGIEENKSIKKLGDLVKWSRADRIDHMGKVKIIIILRVGTTWIG